MCLTELVLEESILLVNLVHVLSLSDQWVYNDKIKYIKETFAEAPKVVDKPLKV